MIAMSALSSIDFKQFLSSIKTSTPLQVGILAAGVSAAIVAWYLKPYLKIGVSVFKGWLLSFIGATPEQRLLTYVKRTAKQGDAQSVIDSIDKWCWSSQWMMNIGNLKGKILDDAVIAAKPKV
jgi:hypothetical protein